MHIQSYSFVNINKASKISIYIYNSKKKIVYIQIIFILFKIEEIANKLKSSLWLAVRKYANQNHTKTAAHPCQMAVIKKINDNKFW